MVGSAPCRKMMMKFANASLNPSQFDELIKLLAVHCPPARNFFIWIRDTYETTSHCPPSIKSFVRAIAASSPVCGFIRPKEDLHTLLIELISGVDIFSSPTKVKILHEECPIIFAALRDLSPSVLPQLWHPMLEELLKKSFAPFPNALNFQPTGPLMQNASFEGLCYFPNLPRVRPRNVYLADAVRRKEDICTKKHPGHSYFLPGIFTLFCPHGSVQFSFS